MYRITISVILILATFITGCDRTTTIRKAQEKATELRMYNRSILKVTNDSLQDGLISPGLHRGVIGACEKFSKALDLTDDAIRVAKTIPQKEPLESQLDYIQRLIDTDVFDAFTDIIDSVVNFPPEVKAKIQEYITAIKLIFSTIRVLFADMGIPVLRRLDYV